MGFFTAADTYEKTIKSPDGAEGIVTLRRLNAGDQAAIQDTLRMSLSEEADANLAIGTMRMLTVERAVVKWDWPGPQPSPESLAQLEPEVFEQIFEAVEIGTPPTRPQTEQAPENGEAPQAETAKSKPRPKPVAAS